MHFFILLLLALFSIDARAHCGGSIASARTDMVTIDIADFGCEPGTRTMIRFAIKEKDGKMGEEKEVPFRSECATSKTGFKCRSDGKTPMAGATYKRISFGRSNRGCASPGDLGSKYLCVKGCDDPRRPGESQVIPEYLVGTDTSC